MSYTVPLYSKDPREGFIEYRAPREILMAVPGFFSFTFYIRDNILGEHTTKATDLYLKGLHYYRQILSKEPFSGWKLLIYTDKYTYVQLHELHTLDISTLSRSKQDELKILQKYSKYLLEDPNVIFAVVDWPRHQRRMGRPSVNGPALRPMRSRAPFDFPDKYVFIRDADTTWDGRLTRLNFGGLYRTENDKYNEKAHEEAKREFVDDLHKWEASLFTTIPKIQKYMKTEGVLIVGTGSASLYENIYKRQWHSNELEDKDSPLGIFAGYVTVTPGVPVYRDLKAWDEFIEYMNLRSVRNNTMGKSMFERSYSETKDRLSAENIAKLYNERLGKFKNKEYGAKVLKEMLENVYYPFSNNEKIHSIGRDEQLYLFILMPKSLDHLFIYHYKLGDSEDASVDVDYDKKMKATYIDALEKGFKNPKKGGRQTRKQKNRKYKGTRKA
jgi:hypothetical protein